MNTGPKIAERINQEEHNFENNFYGIEESASNLLQSFLSDRIQRCCVNDKISNPKSVRCAVPQGSSLGLLLFLIYINDLPVSLRHTRIRIYADDTTLTGSGDSIEKVEKTIKHDLKSVRECTLANKLSLNLVKTEYLISSRFNLRNLGKEPNICVGDIPIKRVKVKAFGVLIDQRLSWKDHMEKLSKTISIGIGAIRRLKSCVDSTTLLSVYNALVQPHFDYCCEVWDSINVTLSGRLEQLYNRAARIITDCPNVHGQSELARNKLGWSTLRARCAFCKA